MKLRAASLLLLLSSAVAQAEPPLYWVCTYPDGHTIDQELPCPEPEELQPLVDTGAPKLVKTSVAMPKLAEPEVRLPSKRQFLKRQSLRPAPAKYQWVAVEPVVQPLKPAAIVCWTLALLGIAFIVIQSLLTALSRLQLVRGRPAAAAPRIEPLLQAHQQARKQWTSEQLRGLAQPQLAELCEAIWRLKGYRAVPSRQPDGVDIRLYWPAHPDRLLAVLRCESGEEPVTATRVREFWNRAQEQDVKLALFYGLPGFSAEARTFAAGKTLRVLEERDLLEQIERLPAGLRGTLLDNVDRGARR